VTPISLPGCLEISWLPRKVYDPNCVGYYCLMVKANQAGRDAV